jgi:hypothetical protein
MPAVAYARLMRILRSLEEGDLYSHESEVLRAAADAKLLRDRDCAERLAEAEEVLKWLAETERIPAELLDRIREQLAVIEPPVRRVQAPPRRAARAPRREGRFKTVMRAMLGLQLPEPEAPVAAVAPVTAEAEDGVVADPGPMLEQAERFLAFHAWLDQNKRR